MKASKKLLCMLLTILSLFTVSLNIYADEGVNWYIKRNGNERPCISDNQSVIEKYNGYYIDKNVYSKNNGKIIYITFDAGYENGNIEKTLDILKEKNVPAAFFILNYIILKNTDIVKRMSDEGHLVCNHTKNHKDMTTLEEADMRYDLISLENTYREKTGKELAKYFRFPEGRYSERTLAIANDMGYKTIFWSFGYADWDNNAQPNSETAYNLIMNNTHDGEVILLHPTSKTNVEILPKLIDKWRDMGYEFGTLDMLTEA